MTAGASKSSISYRAYQQLPKNKQNLIPTPDLQLYGADQRPLKILGRVDIDLDLQGFLVPFSMIVIDSLVESIILGENFFELTKAVISYQERCVTFFDNLIVMDLSGKSQTPSGSVLTLKTNLSVPPKTIVLAQVQIPARFKGVTSVIQPLQISPSQKFLVANTLIQPSTTHTMINILNPYNDTSDIEEKNATRVHTRSCYGA